MSRRIIIPIFLKDSVPKTQMDDCGLASLKENITKYPKQIYFLPTNRQYNVVLPSQNRNLFIRECHFVDLKINVCRLQST